MLTFLWHRLEKQDGNGMRLDLAPGQKTSQPLQVDALLIHNIIQYVKALIKGHSFGQIVNR